MKAFTSLRRRVRDRLAAARDSICLRDEGFSRVQFVRFCMYGELKRTLDDAAFSKRRTLEIGRSNGVIASFLYPESHVVTGDFPAVDVCSMPQFADGSYEVVILDQVLEHVTDPVRAIAEVHRVLRPGGTCIVTTPFMIEIHGAPADYWRFTRHGLAMLMQRFARVAVGQWGNRFTVETCMDYGWMSTSEARRSLRALLRNEPSWPICLWAVATK